MASSSRVIGKGRVLGTPKPPASPNPIPGHVRNPGLLSPSDSTTSLNSQAAPTSESSLEENDISSAVAASAFAVQARENAAAATSRMICPICSEEMVTLLQLNRHLDDDHQNLEVVQQDEAKTWFKTQMVKAKKFQPLAVLNQKLRGLDVFEPNGEFRARSASPAPGHTPSQHSRSTSEVIGPAAAAATTTVAVQDPDELVTKDHWQRYTRDGLCSDPMCGRRLGGSNGNVNCRQCGHLYCEEHTMYQMKLSRSARWDPVRGYWCRVCETCYKSREGYIDNSGFQRDHMKEFAQARRKALDKSYLEASRLEKRLTKLTQLLADPDLQPEQGVTSYLWSFSSKTPNPQRALEQSVVDWEDDSKVSQCPFCRQEFSTYSFRRHHCRICGRVVCADPLTQCSSQVALNVATKSNRGTEKDGVQQIPIDIRMCQDCKRTVFSKSDFEAELARSPPDQRSFDNLKQFEHGIRTMMPRFQKLLAILQDPDKPPSPMELADATRSRKRLTDAFTQYSIAARRIKELPTKSPTQLRLQQQIFAQSSNFLHINMLPLKSLPKILKHASPNGQTPGPSKANGRLHPSRAGRIGLHSPSPSYDSADVPSQSSAISELESEEKELRERLIVLEEQKFMVEEMLRDAQRRRKFEEVESLGRNVEELGKECDGLRSMLEEVGKGFGAVYGGNPAAEAGAVSKVKRGEG